MVGLLITGIALYLFFRSIDLNNVIVALKRVNPFVVLVCAALTIASLFIRSFRFRFLLPDRQGTDKKHLFQLVTIAFMINNILPARLGEAARAYLLYKKNRFSVHVSLGSLVMERVLDSLFFALFIVVPSIIIRPLLSGKKFFGEIDVMVAVRFGWAVVVGVAVLIILYRLFPGRILGFGEKVSARAGSRIGKIVGHLLLIIKESTEWMFLNKKALIIIFLSPFIIVCYALIIMTLAGSMGIDLGFWPAMFSSAVVAFGVAVPSSPGYVGTLHLALRESLVIFGVDKDAASALAILYHLLTWIPVVILGLYFYFRMDVSFKEMSAGKKLDEAYGH